MQGKSEELVEEMERLGVALEEAEKRRIERLGAPEIQSVVLSAMVAGALLDAGDPHLLRLQNEVREIKTGLYDEEGELSRKLQITLFALRSLTKEAIARGIERINHEISDLKFKREFERGILAGGSARGFSGPRVVLQTNEEAILKIKRIVNEATKKLKGMETVPIPAIENFVQEILTEIKGIDTQPIRKEMDSFEYERGEFIHGPRRD